MAVSSQAVNHDIYTNALATKAVSESKLFAGSGFWDIWRISVAIKQFTRISVAINSAIGNTMPPISGKDTPGMLDGCPSHARSHDITGCDNESKPQQLIFQQIGCESWSKGLGEHRRWTCTSIEEFYVAPTNWRIAIRSFAGNECGVVGTFIRSCLCRRVVPPVVRYSGRIPTRQYVKRAVPD